MTNTTSRPAGWSSRSARRLAGAVTEVAQPSLPHSRRDTPPPGWESGVWGRIQRRRRNHRLLALVLTLMGAAVGAFLARTRLVDTPAPLEVRTDLEQPLRTDGSAPLQARWQVRYAGGELRLYRNELAAVLRCPGSPACTLTPGGGAVTFVAEAAGEYRALVFSRAVPASGATMQQDVAGARARGERFEISPSLVVY